MYLTKARLSEIVNKQFFYKLKSYERVFSSLVFIQLFGILVSFGSNGGSGTQSGGIDLTISYYSADMVIIFTMFWAFFTAILITTKDYQNDDFAFVANRLSSNLSNILFLTTASILAGITAMLSGFLLRVIMYLFRGVNFVKDSSLLDAPQEILVGFVAAIMYVLFLSAIGYLVGTLIQLHKSFAFILPIVFFGIFVIGNTSILGYYSESVSNFFFKESSFLLFLVKLLVSIVILFAAAILISNRKEVRQ